MDDRETTQAVPTTGSWTEKPARTVGRRRFHRFVVKTHTISLHETICESLIPYLQGKVHPGDIVVLSEKIVAIGEGRAVPLGSVHPRPVARFLAHQVGQLGFGLGLGRAETMEMAIREAGLWRILLAASVGAVDRIGGRSGDFYRVAGRRVAAIDGPGPTTIAPYDGYIVLAPAQAGALVHQLGRRLRGVRVVVVDVNDVGSEVLAASEGTDRRQVSRLMDDNPMGQGSQSTPVVILRPAGKGVRPPLWATEDEAMVDQSAGSAVWPGVGPISTALP